MPTKMSEATNIDSIRFQEQASNASTVSGYGNVFLKNDKEWYGIDDNALVKRLSGLNTDATNVSNPPTDAELDAIFTSPAAVGNGFACLLDDAGGDANVYLVTSNGTSWWYAALTKAT